ncbi:unnamed protein product [Nezara viridula]|uniref:Uncharacterized protein n=1 Tax=Nezara viridula TaxID=85310 RepID=A0A9P0E9C1_NEZVI|nr:unnamed protein product [Nezara viridula]
MRTRRQTPISDPATHRHHSVFKKSTGRSPLVWLRGRGRTQEHPGTNLRGRRLILLTPPLDIDGTGLPVQGLLPSPWYSPSFLYEETKADRLVCGNTLFLKSPQVVPRYCGPNHSLPLGTLLHSYTKRQKPMEESTPTDTHRQGKKRCGNSPRKTSGSVAGPSSQQDIPGDQGKP